MFRSILGGRRGRDEPYVLRGPVAVRNLALTVALITPTAAIAGSSLRSRPSNQFNLAEGFAVAMQAKPEVSIDASSPNGQREDGGSLRTKTIHILKNRTGRNRVQSLGESVLLSELRRAH